MEYRDVRVLIVENNVEIRDSLEEILAEANTAFEFASTGEEAIAKVRDAEPGQYTLLYIDTKLPGISGYETACYIRGFEQKYKATIPMLALAAEDEEYDSRYALGNGFCNVIRTPVEASEVLRLTRNCANLYQDMYDDPILKEFYNLYEMRGAKVGYFVYEADREERMLFADDVVVEMMGCSSYPEFMEFIDYSFGGFVYEKDLNRLHDNIDSQFYGARDGYDQVAYRIKRKDGSLRKVEDIARRSSSDGPEDLFYVYVVDVTEI